MQPRIYVLPEALKHCRATHNPPLSQKELAERAEVSLGLIGLIETGDRQPRFGNALSIAEALGVDVRAFALVLDEPTVDRLRRVVLTEVAAA